MAINGDRLDLRLEPYHFAAVRFEKIDRAGHSDKADLTGRDGKINPAGKKSAPPAFSITSLDPKQWAFGANANGVKTDLNYDMGDGRKGVKLTSTAYQSEATAELKSNALGKNGTLCQMIRRRGSLRIEIGNSGIFYDWHWNLQSPDWFNDGQLFQNPIPADKTQVLTLSLKDGALDAVYGGVPLAKGLKLKLDESNTLKISTWMGDWFAFDVVEISSKPTVLFSPRVEHPIL